MLISAPKDILVEFRRKQKFPSMIKTDCFTPRLIVRERFAVLDQVVSVGEPPLLPQDEIIVTNMQVFL